MTQSLIYTVLPVGQGTGTLVEVIDDASKKPKAVIVIDLGVTGSKGWIGAKTGEMSAYIVATELYQMDTPTIDALFLSHPDEDHINMIPELLSHFDKPGTIPAKNPLIIKKVCYAGLRSEFSVDGSNIITQLEKYLPNKATDLLEVASNAGDLTKAEYDDNGLKIHIIAGNTVSERGGKPVVKKARKSDGYVKNTDSLVLLLSYGSTTKRHLVATADATGLTMAACLKRLKTPLWTTPVLGISLPHHGSLLTTYNLLGKKDEGLDEEKTAQAVVTEFVNILKPQSVTVSAGESDAYKHPAPQVIEDFAKHAKEATGGDVEDPLIWRDPPAKPGHFYTAYYALGKYPADKAADAPDIPGHPYPARWPSAWGWWPARTTKAIYTVDYFTAASDKKIYEAPIPLVQQDSANLAKPIEAKFTAKDGPFAKMAWIHSWAYTVSEDGATVTFGHRTDDSTNFLDNPDSPAVELARAAPATPGPVLAPAVVLGAARSRTAAQMYRPGRRQVRLLP